MAENLFTFSDNNPLGDIQEPQNVVNASVEKPSVPERSWGEAAEDVTGAVLTSLAEGKKPLAVIASGLNAGLNTKQFQAQKQKLVNAAKRAELDLKAQELRVLGAEQDLRQDAELFPIQKKQAEENLLGTELNNEQRALNIETGRPLSDLRISNAKIVNAQNLLNFQENQRRVWLRDAETSGNRIMARFKDSIGYNGLNIYGQSIIDNSNAVRQMVEAMQIMQAYDRSDEEGDFLLGQTGWTRVVRNNTSFLVSPDGSAKFEASPEGIKKMMDGIQKQVRDDIAASYIEGSDVTTLEQAATRRILHVIGKEGVEQFGGEGSVLGIYNNFVNGSVRDRSGKVIPRFSAEEKLVHVIAQTLDSALEDGSLSAEEMNYLIPLFNGNVKKLGGELIMGDSIDATSVKLRNGTTVPLLKFASDMKQMDKITPYFNQHLIDIKKKMEDYRLQADYRRAQINKINNTSSAKKDGNGTTTPKKNDGAEATSEKVPELNIRSVYGNAADGFSDADKKKIDKAYNTITSQRHFSDIAKKISSGKDVTLDELRLLDTEWQKVVNDPKLYSPFQNSIFQRELNSLYGEIINNARAGNVAAVQKNFADIKMRLKLLEQRGKPPKDLRRIFDEIDKMHVKRGINQKNAQRLNLSYIIPIFMKLYKRK